MLRSLLILLLFFLSPSAMADELSNEEWLDLFRQKVEGLEGPVFAPPQLPPPDCDPAYKRKTHALLVGAGKSLELESVWSEARDNDVALIKNALVSRGADPDNIVTLSGETATFSGFAENSRRLLDRLACGDSVMLHLSGWGIYANRLGIPRGEGGPFTPVKKDKMLYEIPAALGVIEDNPYFLLNFSSPGTAALLRAGALSDLVTLYRNRGADVTVSLDVDAAASFAIEQRQAAADPRQYPRLTLTGELCETDTPTLERIIFGCPGDEVVLLDKQAGALTVFYGASSSENSIEWEFPFGEGPKRLYGYFSYQLANAIVEAERTTVGALARRIRMQRLNNKLRMQDYTFIATDADLDLIAEERVEPIIRRGEIIIDSPSETRAARARSKPKIEIAGRIVARGKPLNVTINGQPASIENGQGFRSTVSLKAGVNGITIFASTDRDEVLRRDFEVYYEGDIQAVLGEGKRYLVVIANKDYNESSGFNDLRTPVGDGRAVAKILTERFGFQTTADLQDGTRLDLFLEDATYRDIQLLMGDLVYAAGENDTVVIFYAGHGDYSDTTGTGYWLPVDARAGRLATYLDAKVITDTLQLLPSKNALVISDSCYSGMLTRDSPALETPEDEDRLRALQRLSDQRSRVVISSGGNEPVADGGGSGHSVFARALLDALADPEMTVFSARELHSRIFTAVTGKVDQSPDIRPIRGAGHEGGDVVLLAAPG